MIRRVFDSGTRVLRRLPPASLWILSLQFLFGGYQCIKEIFAGEDPTGNCVAAFVVGLTAGAFLAVAVGRITIGTRYAHALLQNLIALIYTFLLAFWLYSGDFLRVGLLLTHSEELTHSISLSTLFNGTTIWLWTICVVSFLGLMWWSSRSKGCPERIPWLFAVLGYGLIMACPYQGTEPISLFAGSGIKLWSLGRMVAAEGGGQARRTRPTSKPDRCVFPERPNIYFLILESMAGDLLFRVENGVEVTPNLNALAKRSSYVSNFYGNATYTINGQCSALTSVLCPLFGSIADRYPKYPMTGLAEVLAKEGYTTIFLSAHQDLGFNNTYSFMKKAGFQRVESIVTPQNCRENRFAVWGWGMEDETFYRLGFKRLDELMTNAGPYLVVFSTVIHHVPYDKVPRDKYAIYKEPRNYVERMMNSAWLSDRGIARFQEELKARQPSRASLWIVTADHSAPTGRHSETGMNLSYFEENFRTFCVMSASRQLPSVPVGICCSQVDIPPSILDLLGIAAPRGWYGQSILNSNRSNRALMVQQHDELHLVSVEWPWKYVYSLYSGKERLFNLRADPMERNNIARREPWRLWIFSDDIREMLRFQYELTASQDGSMD